jgi:hypothetical protein
MPTTPNYGWDTPADTDYVTNGALSIRTLGDDADATVYAVEEAKVDRAGDTMTGSLIVPTVDEEAIIIKQDADDLGRIVIQSLAGTERGAIGFNNNDVFAIELTLNTYRLIVTATGDIIKSTTPPGGGLSTARYIPFQIATGLETVSANSDVSVSLPTGFTRAPLIQVTAQSSSSTAVTGHVGGVTTSSFRLYNTSGNTRNFAWQAIQMTSSSAEG